MLTEAQKRVLDRLQKGPKATVEAVDFVPSHPERGATSISVPDLGVLHALWRQGVIAWDWVSETWHLAKEPESVECPGTQ